ncbi:MULTISPECIES: DUF3892 domain-containing protein [unclassified Bacillus (in: firmicutes)]|uniref:DUF3892 domain-containing protein n=1 Tax=unclassified Bacillus (in: firmicutes) TaxID=185979 RepID=UPI001BEBDCAE|nr:MULTISPECIES: DUF3892 domain-containing protein [unclassified Bacillus (in: firmicutes)]MBT2639152.1 DUF3892 domain-containing protein [Bacillus sp. ISL-39]MBT2641965.1 DUF3892 domain-containing protein [Bacillus sp. ISL-41]MBT2662372.1 DUF3892 domain-containing protein [Bacillus sp. ISL-45]
MEQEQLVAIHKNNAGEIISFQTSSGRIISYRKALMEVNTGTITGVNINEGADGNNSLASADGTGFEQFPDIY